jgi:phosphatidylserine/phosphatidylglycerophosphate/cardiolipin synthase-like enzyme
MVVLEVIGGNFMKKQTVMILLLLSVLLNVILGISQLQSGSDSRIDYAFSELKGDPEEKLLEVINGANRTLKIAIYNIDNENIAEAIMNAKLRGVEVQVIVDQENAENDDTKEILSSFSNAGIPIKKNTHDKMHLKLTIADSETVVTGSYNYTEESTEENQELLVSIQTEKLAAEWDDLFNQLWESKDYQTWEN